MLKTIIQFLLLVLPLCSLAESVSQIPFTERTPAYFVDRYGSAKTSKNVSKYGFLHTKHGHIEVKGPFSVRDFRHGDLRVVAIFNLPSLKLAGVKFFLNHSWTPEQIEAALKAFGPDWKASDGNLAFKSWRTPEGTTATCLSISLEIQSAAIVESVANEMEKRDAKRKAVPKF